MFTPKITQPGSLAPPPPGDPSFTITGSFFPGQDLQALALGNDTVAGLGGSKV